MQYRQTKWCSVGRISPNNVTDDPLLTVRQVATELQVSEETVRRWIASKRLPAVKVTRRSGWRIRRSDLDKLLS